MMKISKIMCQHFLCDEKSIKEVPFCIDCDNPVFSFNVEGEGYNEYVKQWRVIVSASRDKIEAGEGDMWDSGFVTGDDILDIKYDGTESGRNARWGCSTVI